MINIAIGLDGVPSESRVILGNHWENKDEFIQFDLPTDFDNYHKYMIAIHRTKLEDESYETITRVLPINNNQFVVSTDITYLSGNWFMYVICREQELNLSDTEVDISPNFGEHVFISNSFIGIINSNYIESELVNNIPLDENLKIIYNDLLNLKTELEESTTTTPTLSEDGVLTF